jgi:hypothetical protein
MMECKGVVPGMGRDYRNVLIGARPSPDRRNMMYRDKTRRPLHKTWTFAARGLRLTKLAIPTDRADEPDR